MADSADEELVLVGEELSPDGVSDYNREAAFKYQLTPERERIILDAIRAGAFIETAVGLAGISKKKFYRWLRDGRSGKHKDYADFARKVNRALHECTVADLATIGIAAQRDWKAAAWRLEHRYPTLYGNTHRSLEVKGSVSLNTAGIFAELERRSSSAAAVQSAAGAAGDLPEAREKTAEEKKRELNSKKIAGFNSRVLKKSEEDDVELPADVLADLSGLGEDSFVTDIPDSEIQ